MLPIALRASSKRCRLTHASAVITSSKSLLRPSNHIQASQVRRATNATWRPVSILDEYSPPPDAPTHLHTLMLTFRLVGLPKRLAPLVSVNSWSSVAPSQKHDSSALQTTSEPNYLPGEPYLRPDGRESRAWNKSLTICLEDSHIASVTCNSYHTSSLRIVTLTKSTICTTTPLIPFGRSRRSRRSRTTTSCAKSSVITLRAI